MRSNSRQAPAAAVPRACLVAASLALGAGCAARPPAPAAPSALPDPLARLRADITAIVEAPGHEHGIWGIAVHSLSRNERLAERNPATLLVPASAMKLVSVAVAAAAVGWDYTFDTTLQARGTVVNGVLEGDLVAEGSGDPTILGRAGEDALAAWAEVLRARGITRIAGRVIADDNQVEEPRPGYAWSWEDLGYTYGSLPGALNLAENAVEIAVRPAASEGLPPLIELPQDASDLRLLNRARTAAAGTGHALWPEFRPGESSLTLNGEIGIDAPPARVALAVGNPTEWFARALRNRLMAAGIEVGGGAYDVDEVPEPLNGTATDLLHAHRSPPLAAIARPLIKDSINLYAEAVLRLATGAEGGRTTGDALTAARARLESWGIPAAGIQMVDGSGLSRRNVLAANTLIALLQRFYDPEGASPWMQAMAVAGRDGSLEKRMMGSPAAGNAMGKTGTMSNVRSFAGYVWTADGEPLAFAILANNFEGPGSAVTAAIDRLVVRLATFSRSRTATPQGRS